MGAVSTQGLLFAVALAFWFFDFSIFPFFLLTIGPERIARYMTEFPRCALYLSVWEQYPATAYYFLALWLFGFLIFLFFISLLTPGTERIAPTWRKSPCGLYI